MTTQIFLFIQAIIGILALSVINAQVLKHIKTKPSNKFALSILVGIIFGIFISFLPTNISMLIGVIIGIISGVISNLVDTD